MRIQTERLVLRPLGLGDLLTAHAYASDVENTAFMLNLPNHDLEETARFLRWADAQWEKEPPSAYEFAVVLEDRHIGAVSLNLEAEGRAGEMGWILRRDAQGQGYALEAALALRDFALGELGLKRLIAHCDARNTASQRLMSRLGMRLESEVGTRQYPDDRGTGKELRYALEIE